MRYYKYLIAFLASWSMTLGVYSQVSFIIDDFKIKPGETKTVNVNMQNYVAVRAFQTRLILPEELELVSRPTIVTDRVGCYTDDFGNTINSIKSVNYNKWEDGSYMIVINSDDAIPFSGNSGPVISFNVKAKSNIEPVTVELSLVDTELVFENGSDYMRPGNTNSDVNIVCDYKIVVSAGRGGKVYGGGIYESGTNVTVTAVPDDGYEFLRWNSGITDNPYTFIAERNMTLSATFLTKSYNLIYLVDGVEYKRESVKYGASIVPEPAPSKEGHTFSGWINLPSTMPARDVTVSGSFTANSYALIYVVDGEEYKRESVKYGAPIVPESAPSREGHTFSGWSEIPSTMPARDVTVSGSFTVNSYALVYVVDGVEYKRESVKYGASIVPESAPSKEGHTFSGWINLPSTMPARDVTVSGSFTANSYALIYVVDGEEYKRESVKYGASIVPEPSPSKEGHTFSGWSEIPSTMPARDVTVSGSFTVNSYALIYVVDGVEYKRESVKYGASIVPEPSPSKEGHTFSGWINLPSTMPARDVTVSGSFTANSYALIYIVDGEEYKRESVKYGASIVPEPSPSKEGHTFSGWSEIPSTMPASDVIVTGKYSLNYYEIQYFVDGVEYAVVKVAYNEEIEPIDEPSKEGYTFSGWSGIPIRMPARNIIVTGTFGKVNSYTITYIVDGEIYSVGKIAYGEKINVIEFPSKEGHTFSGWSEIPSTMPARDVTVSGFFTVNSYALIYVVDGEEYKRESVKYGTSIVPEPAPSKEGHTFSGWINLPSTMPARDVTVSGSFTVNSYALVYVVDGEEYKRESVKYGASIVPEPAPSKEGHTFSGWINLPSTMPARDVTVSGSFTANSYVLIYVVDGEEYKRESVKCGASIVPEPAPSKEGHTFSGWSEIPSTMPARDVTVSGSFTVNSYALIYIVDGVEYKRESVKYGASIVPEPAPSKEGHTFSGWSEIPSTMPARDVTVSGSFTVNSYALIYVVDGVEYKRESVKYGASIVPEPAPSKEGHTFSGWINLPSTMPARDVTVSGSFTANSYALIYVVDGVEYKRESVKYGASIVPEPAPSKEGHTFSGWINLPSTMPARDVTVSGSFTANSYELIYVVDGEEYKRESVKYGASIVPEPAPSKEGHTFSGWSEIPVVMPAYDVLVVGTFTVNIYTVIYIVDGKEYARVDVPYGENIELIDEPAKENYVFSGWSEVPETMPAQDIIVTGSFAYTGIITTKTTRFYMVHMIDGTILYENLENLDLLPSGVYVINGQKVYIK